MFTVYILINGKGKTYTGYTENLERRLSEHNTKQAKYGWSYGQWEWKLLHTEVFDIKKEAIQREKWYKSGIGRSTIHNLKTGAGYPP